MYEGYAVVVAQCFGARQSLSQVAPSAGQITLSAGQSREAFQRQVGEEPLTGSLDQPQTARKLRACAGKVSQLHGGYAGPQIEGADHGRRDAVPVSCLLKQRERLLPAGADTRQI